MTKDELAQAIKQGIQQLGFARVPIPGVLEAFTHREQTPLALPDELKEFADSHGWDYQHAHEHLSNEIVFYPKGTEAPKL